MSSLCQICNQLFENWENVLETLKAGGSSPVIYDHHQLPVLIASAAQGCELCAFFLDQIEPQTALLSTNALEELSSLQGQLTVHPHRTTYQYDLDKVESWGVALSFVPPASNVSAQAMMIPAFQRGMGHSGFRSRDIW